MPPSDSKKRKSRGEGAAADAEGPRRRRASGAEPPPALKAEEDPEERELFGALSAAQSDSDHAPYNEGESQILDNTKVPKRSTQPNKSPPFLTTYERVRIIGQRALQLSMNAEPRVDPKSETDPIALATMELEAGEAGAPRRFLPDGSYEDWRLSDFAW
ncbi:unnamed protein product [Prorocentrum cordatum]|uniref:DNA-directed RNA polymerase n=1 Tax=Prorocentrum cordatum TaxID=2364126 RepID=A0ABN9T150_9DINO|nr:unnamed protein product [Polarella glacialis]